MDTAIDLVFGTFPSWSRLVVRVVLGVVFFAHGAQKVFGWFGGAGLRGTIGYFQKQLGIPPAATVMAAFVECFGGLLVIAGFLTRPVAVALIVVMLVAVVKVHWANGFFLNFALTPGKGHGYEFNFILIGMALSLVIAGAGALSIDGLIAPWGAR